MLWHVVSGMPTALRLAQNGKPIGLDWLMIQPMAAAHGLSLPSLMAMMPAIEAGLLAAHSGDDHHH